MRRSPYDAASGPGDAGFSTGSPGGRQAWVWHRFLVVCYTGLGAAGCAFMFYVSTLPVTIERTHDADVMLFGRVT